MVIHCNTSHHQSAISDFLQETNYPKVRAIEPQLISNRFQNTA